MSDVSPDLNAILDKALAGGDEAAPAEPAAEAPAATATETTAPEEGVPAPSDENNPYAQELAKARREAQNLRERAKQYEQVFGSWSEDDRGTLLSLVTAIRDDPAEANKWWQENIAGALRGEEGPAAKRQAEAVVAAVEAAGVEAPPSSAPAPPTGLTREELLAILDERDKKQRVEQFVSEFEKTAKDLGYDPDSPMYVALTHVAANQTGSDPVAADKILKQMVREFAGLSEEEKQQVVDQYVQDKATKGDSTLPAAAGAPTPPPREGPKSVKEADQMVRAFLEEGGFTGTRR